MSNEELTTLLDERIEKARKPFPLGPTLSLVGFVGTMLLVVGSWVWGFSAMSADVEANSRRISSVEVKMDGVATKADLDKLAAKIDAFMTLFLKVP